MKIFAALFFALGVASFGCSSTRDVVVEKTPPPMVEVSPTGTPFFPGAERGAENFKKEWESKYEQTAARLERQKQLWSESNIPDYDFVAAKYAGGNTNQWNRSPVVIKVRGGERVSIELEAAPRGTYMERTDGFEEVDTIDKLFAYLKKELDSGMQLEVKYDKKSGYPKSSHIIWSWASHGSRSIIISRFTPVSS